MAIKFENKNFVIAKNSKYSEMLQGIASVNLSENDSEISKMRLLIRLEDAIKAESEGIIEIKEAD